MWIRVRTIDGKRSVQIDDLSKLTKIEDLRVKLDKEFGIPPEKQRLFFSGKQLENEHTLFDYNVGLNALIQVGIRALPKDEAPPLASDENKENIKTHISRKAEEKFTVLKEDTNIEPSCSSITSSVWRVKDFVDAKDTTMGAWFEAEIQKIDVNENNEIRYHVTFDGYDENEVVPLLEKDVRPRARRKIPFDQVEKGMVLMANYNCDEPSERGFWYDVKVTRKVNKRTNKEVYGMLLLGNASSVAEECKIVFTDELFQIEKSGSVPGNSEAAPERRKVKPDCNQCKDDPKKSCKNCGCHKCGEKTEPDRQLMCDECDMAYHMKCLDPPMETLPDEEEWYCPLCKNDGSHIIKAGEKLKENKKKSKMASTNSTSTRDWGKGMACVGRTKVCTIVPPNHFGPIPGVPVGSCWKFRVQASEAGVHRPHVSGMHGRDSDGAYSIVLAGGYEDDTDDGEEFTYTGSGGRDLSGNKRTAEQSFDQKLTKTNRALAKNCDCPVNDKEGGQAKDWSKGKPIRVLRSWKFAKHSKYAPEDGIRYDGIYKVTRYWPEQGQSGFIVWRYRLKRDDKDPAPWTKEGRKKTKELGLKIVYPEGYLEAQAKKEAAKQAAKDEKKGKRKRSDEGDRSQAEDTDRSPSKPSPKKQKVTFTVSKENLSLIRKDKKNGKIWNDLMENPESHKKFLETVEDRFMCICCQEVVWQPVTVECGHSTCKPCLNRAFKAGIESCPSCRFSLDKNYSMTINEALATILKTLFPGYDAGR